MKPLNIAVSALHRGENPQPGPSVIKSIRRVRSNVNVIGFSYDSLDSGLYTYDDDHVDTAFLMPYPGKGPKVLLERIDEILKTCPIDIIIPNQDFEIPNYLDLQNDLKDRDIRVGIPSRKAFEQRDKENLYKLCKSVGAKSPKTILANSIEDAQIAAEEIGYPVMLKGRMYGAAQANTPADVPGVYHKMQSLWGGHVLVQSLIESKDELSVIGLGDGQGNVVGSCSIRKILLTHNGKTFSGIVIRNPEMTRATEKIIKKLKWFGPFEIEFIGSDRGYEVIEMNPRFPSWVDFPSQIKCNLPNALVSMLVSPGKSPAIAECEPGKFFVRHCVDLAGDLRQLAHLVDKGVVKCTALPR
jgi:carbamoyl-phosphate synthase large subunit